MIDEKQIRLAINSIQKIVLDDCEARVATQCFYPTNSLVRVAIRGGDNAFVVSDMGGAIREATGAGLLITAIDKSLPNLIRNQGLKIKNGEILSPVVPIEGLGATVALVANASKEIAEWCFSTFRIQHSRSFRKMLSALMDERFGKKLLRDYGVVGKSNKKHKFEYAIVKDNKTMLVDSVARDAASINSRVVANLDIQQIADERFQQFVVYDDEEPWTPPDLMLLKMAATIVPFSSVNSVIGNLEIGSQGLIGS